MPIRYTAIETNPLGPIYLAWTAAGLRFLTANGTSESFRSDLERRFGAGGVVRDDGAGAHWQALLQDWLDGRDPAVELDLAGCSAFERTVLAKTRGIPRGEVRPYQWLAREAGSPGATRAVGTVMRKNPIPLLIPCHRVVTASGDLGNYSMGGPDVKRRLLELEGADMGRLESLARQGYRFKADPLAGTYCYPSCRAGGSGWETVIRTAHEAEAAGLRPCRHCRPV